LDREEDFELVHQLASRDREVVDAAFSRLYEKYAGRIYSTAIRILNDHALAADATQVAFITVLRKAGKFDFRSAFSSWLYRVTVNRCIDLRRQRTRRPVLSMTDPDVQRLAEGGDPRQAGNLGPPEKASQSELAQIVNHAISGLNPRLSIVVVLRYLEGLGYEEIAEILKVPLGTVKSRLNRAHAALEAVLGPRLDETQGERE
jgi:RNA polymerase sigma-70 factor, ECF subfamily